MVTPRSIPTTTFCIWGNHFWSPSYCVVSCGGASLEVVKKYIENQRTPTSKKNAKKSMSLKKS
ncbi:transposase [Acinetobacter sp. YH12049]|uniref:transposase n=1 Tax=Acinetobacter sp. YH12049 TaxID=2601054 RepID=UPI00359FB300